MRRHLSSRQSLVTLAAACSLLMMTASSRAVDLTGSIINANMETFGGNSAAPLVEGRDDYPNNGGTANLDGWRTWADSNNGSSLRLWNPSSTNRWTNASNEFFDTSWGGVAPQGKQVLTVRTQNWNYVGSGTVLDDYGNRTFSPTSSNPTSAAFASGTFNWNSDNGGIRNFEAAAQVTSQLFDPTAKYTLSAKVGRLSDDGFNTGATILPGTDGVHGTADDVTGGNSSRFVNDAPVLYNGYFVDLIAGGVSAEGPSGAGSGWAYGRQTNSADAAYMKVLGVENSLGLTQNTWGTSTVTYLPGSLTPTEVADLAGKKLMIRLGANEAPDHKNTTAVAFDDVHLIKIMAGDANEDDLVNGSDLALLAANFGQSGKNWATADFTGDGIVNGTDLALLAANFGFDANSSNLSVGITLEQANAMLATAAVPEPATWSLLGTAGLSLLVWHRRRKSA